MWMNTLCLHGAGGEWMVVVGGRWCRRWRRGMRLRQLITKKTLNGKLITNSSDSSHCLRTISQWPPPPRLHYFPSGACSSNQPHRSSTQHLIWSPLPFKVTSHFKGRSVHSGHKESYIEVMFFKCFSNTKKKNTHLNTLNVTDLTAFFSALVT